MNYEEEYRKCLNSFDYWVKHYVVVLKSSTNIGTKCSRIDTIKYIERQIKSKRKIFNKIFK